MGNSYSCYQCFSKEILASNVETFCKNSEAETVCSSPFGNHGITESNFQESEQEIETETMSKTDLIDIISKTMHRFMNDIGQDPEVLGYKKVQNNNSIEIYMKDIPSSYSLLSIWKCEIPASKVAKFLQLVEKRKDWDTNVSECKKICDITNDIAVYYTLYKRFLMSAPRDTLIIGQHINNDQGYFDVSTSINSTLVPETPSIVRAQVGIAGYLIQSIEKDSEGNITVVKSISEANYGQSLALSFVKATSVNLAPKFVKSMIDGMKKFDSLLK